MDSNEILAGWQQLLADISATGNVEEMPSIETNTVVAGGNARLAISENEFYTLLLPVGIKDAIDPEQISQVISVASVTLGYKGKNVRFLEVRCEDEILKEVFARVVSDILRRIESGTSGLKAVDEALTEFRKLLNKKHTRSPDEMTVVGLVGELLTLVEILNINQRGLVAWHGPYSDRHDFRAGTVTVEVKTSLGADRNRIHVNGIRQLESQPNDNLLIRHVRIEPDPVGDLSVPDLVAEASVLVTDQTELNEKLENLGYSDEHADSWGAKRYRRIGASTYEVLDDFPRLITDHLKVEWPLAGVSAVSYEVDLGAAANYRVDDDHWKDKLKELAECL
ncbi:MAG: PD-(D/E)XK motif protein [Rhodothermales bacterium]|nr:PD-(D/E)XK motif protein [Rhodothermales bacterium]